MIYNQFTGKKGIDLSVFNGLVNLDRARDKADFVIPRGSAGKQKDAGYEDIDKQCIELGFDEAVYHYLNYYSHTSLGINSTSWGIQQGQFINSINPRKLRVFVDVESTTLNGVATVEKRWGTVITILDNILYQIDQYNGLTNGIYCSLGLLKSFYGYHKHRPLWVAWYNDSKTIENVLDAVTKTGFTNPVIWQAASHGDTDGDGYGNGRDFGTAYSNLDLNYWLRSDDEYVSFFRQTPEQSEYTDKQKLDILWEAYKTYNK